MVRPHTSPAGWLLTPDCLSPAANGFRLPSSEQLEYACRCGTKTPFPFGSLAQIERLAHYARHGANAWSDIEKTRTSSMRGTYMPNRWGFHDLLGNVAELVWGGNVNELRPVYSGPYFLARGFCWSGAVQPPSLQTARRAKGTGFRVALPLE